MPRITLDLEPAVAREISLLAAAIKRDRPESAATAESMASIAVTLGLMHLRRTYYADALQRLKAEDRGPAAVEMLSREAIG
jgi:hypothetical protein